MQTVDELFLTEVYRRTRMSEFCHRSVDKVPNGHTLLRKPPSEVSVNARERHYACQILFPVDIPVVCIQPATLPITRRRRRRNGRRRIGTPNLAVGGRVRIELTLSLDLTLSFAFGLC